MKVVYDRRLPVVGIGRLPWARLGPERWLDNYAIASLYDWDVDGLANTPRNVSLLRESRASAEDVISGKIPLLHSPGFQELLMKQFPGRDYVYYRSMPVPNGLAGCRFLAAKQAVVRRFENKAEFRQMMHGDILFPDFRIVSRGDLSRDTGSLSEILKGRESVIIQDEQLSGGRGTFIVRDPASLQLALQSIAAQKAGSRLVISEHLTNVYERSLQAVVTRFGIFVGPLQKQLVGDERLVNMLVPESDKFCGAEIGGPDPCGSAYPAMKSAALTIGKRLMHEGYKGIFGVDYLIDQRGNVFVLEVNPRITGVTPLLTMMYRDEYDIPFYLLHILELGGYEYQLKDTEVDAPAQGSMLVLHSLAAKAFRTAVPPQSGIYDPESLTLQDRAVRLDPDRNDRQILLQCCAPLRATMEAGGRVAAVFSNTSYIGPKNDLTPAAQHLVQSLRESIGIEEA